MLFPNVAIKKSVWWKAYQQTAGCWAGGGGVHQLEPAGGEGAAGQPAGRPPSHSALPSHSAIVCHSEGGGTLRTGLPDRCPHQKRKSPLLELGDTKSDQTECDMRFYMFSSILPFWCNVIQWCWKLDEPHTFTKGLSWQLVNILQCVWCCSNT